MNEPGFLDIIGQVLSRIVDAFWFVFSAILDLLKGISGLWSFVVVMGLLGLFSALAWLTQRRLNAPLLADPRVRIRIWQFELMGTFLGPIIWLVKLPFVLAAGLVGLTKRIFSKPDAVELEKAKREKAELDAARAGPLLVATLGPSFMWGALITAALYLLLVFAFEPLARLQMKAPAHFPALQFLLIGHRPELGWYLPLESHPNLAIILTTILWMTLWWWVSRIVRLSLGKELGRNLADSRSTSSVLASWRNHFGVSYLARTDDAYRRWARFIWLASVPLVLLAWSGLQGDPYRIAPSMFSVALVLWLAWGLNLALEGIDRRGTAAPEAPHQAIVYGAGWPEVLADLTERYQAEPPLGSRPTRIVEPLPFSTEPLDAPGPVSPLLRELLPEPRRLTPMQHAVLSSMSLQAYVHVAPPVQTTELRLDNQGTAEGEVGLRHRNQLILAPAGSGKTALAILAAANHAIVHAKTTLMVARNDEAADALQTRFQHVVTPSSLRWNLRVRRVGGDIATDFSQGVTPDVIICSLRQLVANILDQWTNYRPFLENLGLIIVDDIEDFCGPVEVHAQLGFRRLNSQLRELLHIADVGEKHAPALLMLGVETMQDMRGWVRAICSADAIARRFDYGNLEFEGRESAALARKGRARQKSQAAQNGQDTRSIRQEFFRSSDFLTKGREKLTLEEIIGSCERLAVPWHYCSAGDDRRKLGRRLLSLTNEPLHFASDPADACVVIVAGAFTAVERELRRLSRAGLRFVSARPPKQDEAPADATAQAAATASAPPTEAVPLESEELIAVITQIDGDEEMAFTEFDKRAPLAAAIEALPRPFLRHPSGATVKSHLSADLVTHWKEVRDILDVFGNDVAEDLLKLADANLLQTERRTDIATDTLRFEPKLYLRALSSALGAEAHGGSPEGELKRGVELPPKVNQVETASLEVSAVRDRTSLNLVAEADAGCADVVYHPGRIFTTALGTFVVVDKVKESDAQARPQLRVGDVLVEPYIGDEISSPRRKVTATLVRDSSRPSLVPPEPLLIGRAPLELGLCEVDLSTHHVATFRLSPRGNEVRQRILSSVQDARVCRLRTLALVLVPNPAFGDGGKAPKLTLGQARLIAATMRAILPLMYRGADSSMDVALHVGDPRGDDSELGPKDAFLVYDLHEDGNGASRAVYRDGVELLLRMVRSFLERVLYHDSVLARFDHWGDRDEILREIQVERRDLKTLAETSQKRRQSVLEWLDSRLRPEGSRIQGTAFGQMQSSCEAGEGDLFDLGRAWFTSNERVTDLVWARHIWRISDRIEVACDIGFDRQTLLRATHLAFDKEPLSKELERIGARAQSDELKRKSGPPWGSPVPAQSIGPTETKPVAGKDEHAQAESSLTLALRASAMATQHWFELEQLKLLLEKDWSKATDPSEPIDPTTRVVRLVQAMPPSNQATNFDLKSPVYSLLHRRGTRDSHSLLLAILLKRLGIHSGLFFCPAENLVVAAVEQDATDIAAWARQQAQEEGGRVVFATYPDAPSEGAQDIAYVAVDTVGENALGIVQTNSPDGWVFIPLHLAWEVLPDDELTDDGEGGA